MNEKEVIYDTLSRVLTNYEDGYATEEDLYYMLVDIQNRWESVITAEDD